MITLFEPKKPFIFVTMVGKMQILLIGILIILVTPILEKSMVFSIFILGVGLIGFIFEVFKAHERDIYSLKFDDDAKILTVISYKYGLQPIENTIEYDKLWYALGGIKYEILTGVISTFDIEKKESRDAPITLRYSYVKSILGAFSVKQFYEINEKLKEVGHDDFAGGITKFF